MNKSGLKGYKIDRDPYIAHGTEVVAISKGSSASYYILIKGNKVTDVFD